VPMWLEVYVSSFERWVSVDATISGRPPAIDRPEETLATRVPAKGHGAAAAHAYVVGLSGGDARDVTARYAVNLAASHAKRTDSEWWQAALRAVHAELHLVGQPSSSSASSSFASSHLASPAEKGASSTEGTAAHRASHATSSAPPRSSESGAASSSSTSLTQTARRSLEVIDVDAEDAEATELARRAARQPLPSSLSEYKRHPLYILQRDIKSTQAIHPPSTKPVGLCKGQRVYPRMAVHELRTEQAWFRRGFDLQSGAQPAKVAHKKPEAQRKQPEAETARAAEGDAPVDSMVAGDGGGGTVLYGAWQVEPHQPRPVVGGVVPRSTYGHVELWTAAHLPLGSVHMQEPGVAQAAKQLGVDAAPAMVGFDVRDGRPVPKFDGVVVCVEHAEVLREAAAAMAEQAEDKEVHKQHAEALSLWRALIRALAIRRRLEEQYGDS
jgi:hypothetical protein